MTFLLAYVEFNMFVFVCGIIHGMIVCTTCSVYHMSVLRRGEQRMPHKLPTHLSSCRLWIHVLGWSQHFKASHISHFPPIGICYWDDGTNTILFNSYPVKWISQMFFEITVENVWFICKEVIAAMSGLIVLDLCSDPSYRCIMKWLVGNLSWSNVYSEMCRLLIAYYDALGVMLRYKLKIETNSGRNSCKVIKPGGFTGNLWGTTP